MIKKFIKKPIEVEAIQFNGNSNKQEVESFVGKELKSELESETAYIAGKGAPIFSLLIDTKEGVMKAMKGDWIIKEPFPTGDRDFYPCKNDIFINTYDGGEEEGELINELHCDLFNVMSDDLDDETGAALEEVILIKFLGRHPEILAEKNLSWFVNEFMGKNYLEDVEKYNYGKG